MPATQSYSQRVSGAVDELDLCCGFLDHVRQRPATEHGRQTSCAKPWPAVQAQEAAL